MKKSLFIKTYGCQMNVYDSKRMADVLAPLGYNEVDQPEKADLVILNTCHIREKAAEKVYSDIGRIRNMREARRNEGGDMMIAVAGCVAQAEGPEIMRRAPAVDIVLGPQTYHRLPRLVNEAEARRQKGQKSRVLDTDFPEESKFDSLPGEFSNPGPAAFLTIQEGCDKFCTFCVVPYTRGAEFSRPVADIEKEAAFLVAGGTCEITLLGQNVNAYHGVDENGVEVGLSGLAHRLGQIDGLKRLRYTTSHPRDMDDSLIEAHRNLDVLMPYLHLPVQSGSDAILKVMNRRHTADQYLRLIDKIRSARPDIALSGDFIVGFPGETDKDFEATLRLVKAVGYAQAYSFKYSPRPGTPAADSADQVPEHVKAERLDRLQSLLNKQQETFNKNTVGKTLPVLFERAGKHKGQYVGRSPYMQAVHVTLDERGVEAYTNVMGKLLDVTIVSAGPNSLEGCLTGQTSGLSAA